MRLRVRLWEGMREDGRRGEKDQWKDEWREKSLRKREESGGSKGREVEGRDEGRKKRMMGE